MLLKKLFLALPFALLAQGAVAQSVGGITTGATLYCDSLNSGFISLSAYTGQVNYWEVSTDGGQNWKFLPNTTSTQSYNKLTKTSSFRAIVQDANSLPDTSTVSTITVYIAGNAGTLSGGGLYCNDAGTGNIILNGAPGNVLYWQYAFAGETSWTTVPNTSTTFNYSSITRNTRYRAVVKTVNGCPDDTSSIASFSIQPKTIAGIISKSDSLCYGAPGDTLRLTEFAGKLQTWSFSKDNGSSWTVLTDTNTFITYTTVTHTQWFRASVKNGICPVETTTPAVIALHNSNPASAGNDITITRHERITLQGSGNGNPEWNNPEYLSDKQSFHPVADPMNTTTYVLTLTDQHGCRTKDSVIVSVIVPIPTAITPNGDGVNDYFEIEKIGQYGQNSLMIFNRWGIEVYKASPYTNTWDGKSEQGKDLPDDLYYYVFDYGNGEKAITNYILIKR